MGVVFDKICTASRFLARVSVESEHQQGRVWAFAFTHVKVFLTLLQTSFLVVSRQKSGGSSNILQRKRGCRPEPYQKR